MRQFDLSLNYKKTKIEKLPISSTKDWKHILNSVQLVSEKGYTTYTEVNHFIDVAIQLADEENDSAVLKYAIKAMSGNKEVSENGKKVAGKRVLHLAILYPFLLPLMEQYVFSSFEVAIDDIKAFAEALYTDSFRINNYEGIIYAIYFSLRYGFDLVGIDCGKLIKTGDCLCLLFTWLYYKDKGGAELSMLEQEAKSLSTTALDRNWLFCYEILDEQNLPEGDWRTLKKAGISFLKNIRQNSEQESTDD